MEGVGAPGTPQAPQYGHDWQRRNWTLEKASAAKIKKLIFPSVAAKGLFNYN
jgi:hypothetical protein